MSFQGFDKPGDSPSNEPDCYCLTCEEEYHHLGIMSHRAMHRRREEDCKIQFSDGRTVSYAFSRKRTT